MLLLIFTFSIMNASGQENRALNGKCLIIGHRGAPAFGGENTLFGFRKALELGADGFELDLIQTKDGKLIIGHDYELNRLIGEDQLAEKYPDRKHGKKWIITDFTQEELHDLKVTFPAPGQDYYDHHSLSGEYKMPLLSEALTLILAERRRLNRPDLKIYIEIKTKDKYMHTMSMQDISDQIKQGLLDQDMLNDQNVWIQSFDNKMMNVIAAEPAFNNLDKCQLGFDDPVELSMFRNKRTSKKYLKKKIIGRNLQMFHIWKTPAKILVETRKIPLVKLAHKQKIPIHLYTFRDPYYKSDYKAALAMGIKGFESTEAELHYFINLGFDAIMTDYISSAIKVRDLIYSADSK